MNQEHQMSSYEIFLGCAAAFFLLIVVDGVRRRSAQIFLVQLTIGALTFGLSVFVLRENASSGAAFGLNSQFWAIAAIGAGAVLGIIARCVFDLDKKHVFEWLGMLKPLCISPIVLMPLLATVQGRESLEPFQIVMLCLLSFQNGFFWQAVLDKVRLRTVVD